MKSNRSTEFLRSLAGGRTTPLLITLSMIAAFVACGGNSKSSGGGGSTAPIKVAISEAPAASLSPGATTSLTATVTNDSTSAGVTWSCAPANSCGSFSSGTKAVPSDTAVTYTAPSSTGNVILTATSVANTAVSASANVTLTTAASGTLASGNYVFFLSGYDPHKSPYFVAGVITISTSGSTMTITGGEQDFSDYYNEVHDTISSGTIAASTSHGDQNLTITLQTGDPCIGPGATDNCTGGSGQEILNAALISNSHAQLTEFDTWASASGTLDLQSSSIATPSGSYAFYLTGIDKVQNALALGGVINVDNSGGTGGISGAGSIFDINDFETSTPANTFTAGSVSSPDAYGLVTFNLNSGFVANTPGITLAGYMIDNSHIQIVENTNVDHLRGTTGGNALLQTGVGTFSTSSISGSSYVLSLIGADNVGTNTIAGILTFNSDGSVSGNLSFNDTANQSPQGGTALAVEITSTPCSSGSAATACYIVDNTGRVTITNVTDSATTPTFAYNLELYVDGNGNAFVVSMTSSSTKDGGQGPNGPNGLSGVGFRQTGTFNAASLLGSYALNIDQQDGAEGFECDGAGIVVADGVGAFSGYLDLSGVLSTALTPTPDVAVTATFATTSTNGVFTGNISGIASHPVPSDKFTFYLVNPTKSVAIENDQNQLTLGVFELQQ
jgi:hypothetical protein